MVAESSHRYEVHTMTNQVTLIRDGDGKKFATGYTYDEFMSDDYTLNDTTKTSSRLEFDIDPNDPDRAINVRPAEEPAAE